MNPTYYPNISFTFLFFHILLTLNSLQINFLRQFITHTANLLTKGKRAELILL
jgi:hypothetical protein